MLSERLAMGPLFSMTGSALHMLKADDASFIIIAFPDEVIHAVKPCWMKRHHVRRPPAAFPAVIEARLQDAFAQCPITIGVCAVASCGECACSPSVSHLL